MTTTAAISPVIGGIVTSTAPGLPAGDLYARMITRQLVVTRIAGRHQRRRSGDTSIAAARNEVLLRDG